MRKINHEEAHELLNQLYGLISSDIKSEVVALLGDPDKYGIDRYRYLIDASSAMYTAREDDFVLFAGYNRIDHFRINIWLLATEGMLKHRKFLMRETRGALEQFVKAKVFEYPMIASAEIPRWFGKGTTLLQHHGFMKVGTVGDNDIFEKEI